MSIFGKLILGVFGKFFNSYLEKEFPNMTLQEANQVYDNSPQEMVIKLWKGHLQPFNAFSFEQRRFLRAVQIIKEYNTLNYFDN